MSAELAQALMEVAHRLPPDVRAWLVAGFEQWQHGDDLAEALGLNDSLLDRRDELLRLVIPMCPGDTPTARCFYFIACLEGDQEHQDKAARRYISKLQRLPVPVPRSVHQLKRIMANNRGGTRAEIAVLCPSWPVVQTCEQGPGQRKRTTGG